ncbi:ABC transporter ATP-binding protein [Mycoplasmatota bacterium]|nr:ABC transporter ATP-binding protein [Mycoplasmatota bacterium]
MLMIKISLKNVSHTFQSKESETETLKDVSFDVKEGEFISVIGPSGCGKSTILNLISSLIKPQSGSIYVKGKIGYMLQRDHLFEWRTIFDNCLIGPEIQKMDIDESKEYTLDLLKRYGLIDFKDHHPHQLSGGMRQRVALIRTLAIKPNVLLLDEAFSALDSQTRLLVGEDVWKILRKENKTAIFVTHDIAEAISLSDRIVILSERPASVQKVVKLDFNRLSPLERRRNTKFPGYFDYIWNELKNYD